MEMVRSFMLGRSTIRESVPLLGGEGIGVAERSFSYSVSYGIAVITGCNVLVSLLRGMTALDMMV